MLAEEVVMITGVGSGLGRALAQLFADQRPRSAFPTFSLDIVRSTLRPPHRKPQKRVHEHRVVGDGASGGFFGYLANVANYAEVEALASHCAVRHGGVDVLFNNATVYPKVNFL